MANKSKTQRAKASAARAARKEQALAAQAAAAASAREENQACAPETPKRKVLQALKRPFVSKSKVTSIAAASSGQSKTKSAEKNDKKIEKKPTKKRRFAFIKDVKGELKRVTWPTKQDVLRWTVVVVVALVFFGIYVALLDNIITPVLVAVSSLGA